MHTAAREMVYVAEQGLLADKNTMDPTWQEMLNHATAKVRTLPLCWCSCIIKIGGIWIIPPEHKDTIYK